MGEDGGREGRDAVQLRQHNGEQMQRHPQECRAARVCHGCCGFAAGVSGLLGQQLLERLCRFREEMPDGTGRRGDTAARGLGLSGERTENNEIVKRREKRKKKKEKKVRIGEKKGKKKKRKKKRRKKKEIAAEMGIEASKSANRDSTADGAD